LVAGRVELGEFAIDVDGDGAEQADLLALRRGQVCERRAVGTGGRNVGFAAVDLLPQGEVGRGVGDSVEDRVVEMPSGVSA